MALLTPTLEEFESRLNKARAESGSASFGRLAPAGVACLALVPVWTDTLARAVEQARADKGESRGAFPTGDLPLEEFVRTAQALNLCESHTYETTQTEYDELERRVIVAPYLDAEQREQALQRVLALEDARTRAQFLVRLIPALSKEQLAQVATAAERFDDPRARTELLAALVPFLAGQERTTAVENTLRAASTLTDPSARDTAKARLLPEMTADECARAVRELLYDSKLEAQDAVQAQILVASAPYVRNHDIDAVNEVLKRIRSYSVSVNALSALVAQAPVEFESRRAWLVKGAENAREIRNADEQARALTVLAQASAELGASVTRGQTGGTDVPDAQELVNRIPDPVARGQALGILAHSSAERGATEMADSAAERALRIAQDLADSRQNPAQRIEGVQLLTNLAARWTAHSLGERAHAALEAGLIAGSDLPSQPSLVATFGLLGQTFARWGMEQEAEASRTLARAACETTKEDPVEYTGTLLKLLPYETESGQARAKLTQQVMRLSQEISNPQLVEQNLIILLPYTAGSEREMLLKRALNPPPPPLEFWMPDGARATTIDTLQKLDRPLDLEALPRIIAQQITDLALSLPIPSPTKLWMELATQPTPHDSANLLDKKTVAALKAADLPQATAWINAGTFLAQTVKGELENGVVLGRRRIELVYRQKQDEAHLTSMLVRQPQVDAFEALLTSSSYWALHYIGLGGMGKTMLVRYLMRLMRARGIRTGRIDFDYLPPSFPVRKPGLLLGGFMDELQPQATLTRQEGVAEKVRHDIIALHEGASEGSVADPLERLHSGQFDEVLDSFCSFIQTLEPPVVLILDTCEELAKLQPEGVVLKGVQATFEIVERVHRRVPSVRVLFAGRRFLTQSGYGWKANEGDEGARALEEMNKGYLALFEIRGFDQGEALEYLRSIKNLRMAPELEEAILKRSLEPGTVGHGKPILWDPPRERDVQPRYNPFELTLYADWVHEVPSLTPKQLASEETDPYIQWRLVDRLHNPDMQRALPTAALMGRFDAAMLTPLFADQPGKAEKIWKEFAALEWTDQQGAMDSQNAFVEIERNLQKPLRTYFEMQNPAALDLARRTLIPWLDGRLANAGRMDLTVEEANAALDGLTVEQVNAALRFLPGARAAELWEELSYQVARAANWGWAFGVTSRLLDEDGAVDTQHPARANVRATYVSAVLHLEREFDATAQWAQVSLDAAREPNPAVRDDLKRRALLGAMTATQWNDRTLRKGEVRLLRRCLNAVLLNPAQEAATAARTRQRIASLLAAVEALVERAEMTGQASSLPAMEIENWARRVESYGAPRALWYSAYILAARAHALERAPANAAELLDTVAKQRDVSPPDGAQTWMDWRAPESLLNRLRLEDARLRALVAPKTVNVQALSEAEHDALRDLAPTDCERFVSASLGLRLARSIVPAAELEQIQNQDSYRKRPHACQAHRVTPLLCASVALAWLGLSDAKRALTLLDERLDAANKSGKDPVTVRAVEQAKLVVLRRMRLTIDSTLVDRFARSEDPEDVALAYPVMALTQSPDSDTFLPGREYRSIREDVREAIRAHVYFRSTPGQQFQRLQRANAFVGLSNEQLNELTQVEQPFVYHSLALDSIEYERVTGSAPFPRTLVDPEKWLAAHPLEIEPATRLALRQAALDSGNASNSTTPALGSKWAERLGARSFAELAQDEGELLALRLPREGRLLLNLANDWFGRAGDSVGQVRAATTAMIAELRVGEQAGAEDILNRQLRPLYKNLAESRQQLGLPSWDRLVDEVVTSAPSIETLHLGGWEERIALGQTALGDAAQIGENKKRLSDWFARRYSPSLPVELRMPKQERAAPASRGTKKKEVPPRSAKPLVRIEISPDTSTIGSDVFRGGSVLTTLRVQELATAARSGEKAETVTSVGVATVSRQKEYRTESARLPGAVTEHLRKLSASVKGANRLEAGLLIAPEAQETNWEALLTWNLQHQELDKMLDNPRSWTAKLSDLLRMYRLGETASAPLPVPSARVVRVLASRRWASHITGGWDVFGQKQILWGVPADPSEPMSLVIHIMGQGTRTTAGVQIQQDTGPSLLKTTQQSSPGREGLLSADAVPHQNAAFVVVQGEPQATSAARVESEREQANILRAFASQVFRAGANAVLVLPSLPSPLVVPVLTVIAEALKRTPRPKLKNLLDLREKVRRVILNWRDPDAKPDRALRETQLELALDVTLWARPGDQILFGATEEIRATFRREAQLQQIVIPADHVSPPLASAEPLAPDASYFRLWLAGCSLAHSRAWDSQFPLVYAEVILPFGDRNVTFSRIALAPQEIGTSARLNLDMSELMPYRGGTVSVNALLYALPEQESLRTAWRVLSELGSLVRTPLANTLALAEKLATGARDLLSTTDAKVRLGWHVSFDSQGGMALKPGYHVVLLASQSQVPPDSLFVRDGALFYGTELASAKPLEGFDYLLWHIEGRQEREDWRLGAIEEYVRLATDAQINGNEEDFNLYRRMAQLAVFQSPDLTQADRRRVLASLRQSLQELQDK